MPASRANSALRMSEPSPRTTDLEAALRVTERMLDLARNGAWDDLPRLEGERLARIQAGFSDRERVSVDEAEVMMGLTVRLLRLNEKLAVLCAQGRDESATALANISRGRRARQAYTRADGSEAET